MTSLQGWLVETAIAPMAPTSAQLDEAVRAVRDLGSVAVIGTTSETTAKVARYVDAVGSDGPAAVIGSSRRVDPVSAALLNGTAAQAFDFDDIAPACVSHVSAIMVPAVAALLDRFGAEKALAGYVKGLSVIGRLAEAFTHEVYDRGIQPTHTMGPIGAVTALLDALDADEPTARAAFGLLATQMIGLRSHTGTVYKPVQAGVVAAAAVRSVLLALEGIEAGDDAVDVVMRLLGITDEQLRTLQRDGELTPVALAPKWYPTCGAAHTAIEAVLTVRERADGRTGDPVQILVTSPPRVMNALAYDRPANPDEARFSMHYCIATAWANGALGPADFSSDALARDDVARLAANVHVEIDDSLSPPPSWSGFPAVVQVTWESGERDTARVERPLGYPERPLDDKQRKDKFVACVAPVLGDDAAIAAYGKLSGPDVFESLLEHLTT